MGIPTLISTHTADGDSELEITSGIDSTYDEYMFVMTDIGPATNSAEFTFSGSVNGGTDSYDVTKTTTMFTAAQTEAEDDPRFNYDASGDLAQSTDHQIIMFDVGNGSDESGAGILHLFSPSNTTYVKHFYSRTHHYHAADSSYSVFVSGYFNTTTAINAIEFKMSTGDFDGVIQMYGIS